VGIARVARLLINDDRLVKNHLRNYCFSINDGDSAGPKYCRQAFRGQQVDIDDTVFNEKKKKGQPNRLRVFPVVSGNTFVDIRVPNTLADTFPDRFVVFSIQLFAKC